MQACDSHGMTPPNNLVLSAVMPCSATDTEYGVCAWTLHGGHTVPEMSPAT